MQILCQAFFSGAGTRYKRIGKRPGGVPPPQLCGYKFEKLQKLEQQERGLFLFYPPPYSPHLNIAETLWRILKGKWIRPQDYVSSDTLFYSTNRALAAVGKRLFINFSHIAI